MVKTMNALLVIVHVHDIPKMRRYKLIRHMQYVRYEPPICRHCKHRFNRNIEIIKIQWMDYWVDCLEIWMLDFQTFFNKMQDDSNPCFICFLLNETSVKLYEPVSKKKRNLSKYIYIIRNILYNVKFTLPCFSRRRY